MVTNVAAQQAISQYCSGEDSCSSGRATAQGSIVENATDRLHGLLNLEARAIESVAQPNS